MPHKPTQALATFAATLDAGALPDAVRQKLGWLLLDYLRVCSLRGRLPWSAWWRQYAGMVARAGAAHVLFSPERLNPQHATFLNVAFGSSFDADDTHVGAMLHPGLAAGEAALASAETAAQRGGRGGRAPSMRYPRPSRRATWWRRSWPATRARSVSGSAFSRRISAAASRVPAPAGASARRGRPRRAAGHRAGDRAGGRLCGRACAVLLLGRLGQAHPGGTRRPVRGRGRAADAERLCRPDRHHPGGRRVGARL